jgi:hypothetical protein
MHLQLRARWSRSLSLQRVHGKLLHSNTEQCLKEARDGTEGHKEAAGTMQRTLNRGVAHETASEQPQTTR